MEGKFTIINEEGKEVECEVLFTFESNETNKNYIVYTDNTFDEDGNTKVFASTYSLDEDMTKLQPIETEKEWQVIEIILGQLQEQIHGQLQEQMQQDNIDEEMSDVFEISEDKMTGTVGMEAYANGNFELAEKAFKESGCKNNLAYMIRRGEVKDPSQYSMTYVAELLKEEVQQRDPFAMINMALLWALNVKGEDSWKLADNIMSMVPAENSSFALRWWFDVAREGDVEGYLVHYWMLRHRKIEKTLLGSKAELLEKVAAEIKDMPSFMK